MSERYVVGVDLGSNEIKTLAVKLYDKDIEVLGSGTVPSLGIQKGSICDTQSFVKAIVHALDCALLSIPHSVIPEVYFGIGGDALSYSSVQGTLVQLSDIIRPEDVERVCHAAALNAVQSNSSVLHVVPKKFYVDQQEVQYPLGKPCKCLEVEAFVISVSNHIYAMFEEIWENKGIKTRGIVANVIVAEAALSVANEKNYYFIDVGAGSIDIIMRFHGQIYLVDSFLLGGEYITRDIMQGLEVDFHHAEDIKRYHSNLDANLFGKNVILDCNGYGTTDKNISFDFLSQIVGSRVEEIVQYERIKSLHGESKGDLIFLSGGCSAMPCFVKEIEKIFEIPVCHIVPNNLPAEYAITANVNCYGIIQHVLKNHSQQVNKEASNDSAWSLLLSSIKKIFNR